MKAVRFLGLSALGAFLWVGAFLALGALLKPQIERLLPQLVALGGQALTAMVLLLLAFIGFKWWERRRFYAKLRMARISVTELLELMEAQQAPLILDVRSPSARQLEPRRIPGALHVPVDQAAASLKGLPRDRDIVVYCTCPNEASAAGVARLLMNHGFRGVRPLHGGLDAWVEAGYAVESLTTSG
jgi:rhodanese-related sulfurtransferase